MINSKAYLSHEEISLKEKIEESIKIFYEDFILNKIKLDLDCHEHFQEIRFQLDQHREELKEKVDNIYMEMIEETKEYESSYLKKFGEKYSAPHKKI